jgi:hypothetical protein
VIANNFSCVPNNLTNGYWSSANISYDLSPSGIASQNASGFIVVPDSTNPSIAYDSETTSSNATYFANCAKLGLTYFGSSLGYKSQIIKTVFGLPTHSWVQIKFQFLAIDNWKGDSLLLEINSNNSYNKYSIEYPQTINSYTFNSSQRIVDLCGSATYPDSLAVIDNYFSHSASSLKFRIKVNPLSTNISANSSVNQLYFGVR